VNFRHGDRPSHLTLCDSGTTYSGAPVANDPAKGRSRRDRMPATIEEDGAMDD